jgi:ketosteroid isomerase-like protein
MAAEKDPIYELRQEFLRAAKAGDVEALARLAADDIVTMSPNDTTLFGKDEYKAWWEEYFEYFKIEAFSEAGRSIEFNGDFAIEVSGYTLAIIPVTGGSRIRDDGRVLSIWKRQPDQSWKIWQMMWNSSKPVGIGTNRYMSRLAQKKAKAKQ